MVRTTWHLDNWWYILWAVFCNIAMFGWYHGQLLPVSNLVTVSLSQNKFLAKSENCSSVQYSSHLNICLTLKYIFLDFICILLYFSIWTLFPTGTSPTILMKLKNLLFLTIVIPGGFRLARNLTSGSQVYFLKPHRGMYSLPDIENFNYFTWIQLVTKTNFSLEKRMNWHMN